MDVQYAFVLHYEILGEDDVKKDTVDQKLNFIWYKLQQHGDQD